MTKPKGLLQRHRLPGDLVFSASFLVIALFLLSQLGSQTQWTKGTKLFAQPAFWPAVSLSIMSVFALFHFLGAVRSEKMPGRGREVALWFRSFEYAVWFMTYVWIVPILGYLGSTLIFTLLLTLRVGYRDRKTYLMAAAMAVVIVVVFKGLLAVRIPGGSIYNLLPDALRNFMLLYL